MKKYYRGEWQAARAQCMYACTYNVGLHIKAIYLGQYNLPIRHLCLFIFILPDFLLSQKLDWNVSDTNTPLDVHGPGKTPNTG